MKTSPKFLAYLFTGALFLFLGTSLPAQGTNPVVRFNTNFGPIDVELLPDDAPKTVANFLGYLDRGDYDQSFLHRLVKDFVLQGGGYRFVNGNVETIPTKPPVMNEFKVSNVRGTIAMAKLGSDPDSATDEWFFNLADNSANLDTQNGGFTVFGRVLDEASQAVIDRIAGLEVTNAGSPFDQLPVINYNSGDLITADNLVTLISLVRLTDNTPAGQNISVKAPGQDATVFFSSVDTAGVTTFTPIAPPSSAGSPPAGYTISNSEPAYKIVTTAGYQAPLTVTFTVSSGLKKFDFDRLRILHGEGGKLVDRTILAPGSPAPNFGRHTVSARVDSLSPFVIALAPRPSSVNALVNIATRLQVLTGEKVLIGGFIVTGNEPKKVLLRAIGPSLGSAGISHPLANPVLELHAANGSLIRSNDDWQSTQKAAIEATAIPPKNKLESAIVATLDPGSYTAIVKGKGGGTGIGLVEVYDLNPAADAQLANISTRGFVDTGNNVMIGGLILGGNAGSTNVLVRALGPSLASAGVNGALSDPTLELRNANGDLVRSNDNWKEGSQQSEITASGAAPKNALESALVETLSPGSYTAIVAGHAKGTGVGLVEAFRLP